MKMLVMIAIGLILASAVAACGGEPGIAPAYQLAYGVCVDNAIVEDGFTETHAARYCTCLIDKLAKDYTGAELYTIMKSSEMPSLTAAAAITDSSTECLSK
jgi:hypothetical protein